MRLATSKERSNAKPATARNKPDAFLYSMIRQDCDAFLTVLSLLARQDLDPWDEAASYASMPRAAAITQLADLLAGLVPNDLGDGSREEAAQLLKLLPRPDAIASLTQNRMWQVLKDLFERLRYVAEVWRGDHRR